MSDMALHPDNAAQAEHWNGPAGRRWRDHQERQDQVLLPVLDRLVAAADARPGERVIDVGCGAGATAIDFALKVAPHGEVLAIDVSAPLIERARERAGDLPVRFVLADAAAHPLTPGWADLIVSRFGVMFFADPTLAFRNLRRGLRPGGRMAFACWREAKLNPWIVVPLRAAANHAPPLPETGPECPGPFAFADPARVRRILGGAGFVDVDLEPHELELDMAAGRGLDTAVEGALTIGPASRMLQDQSEDVRAAAAADIRAALAAHAQGDRVPLPGAVWIVTARNP
jgi:SAM-dependent methyltransferase